MTSLLPNVSPNMLSPEFWTSNEESHRDCSKVRDTLQTWILEHSTAMIHPISLRSRGSEFAEEQRARLNGAPPDVPALFDASGQPLTAATWQETLANADGQPLSTPQPGVTVRRADLRRWPTSVRVFKRNDDREFDRWQDTALHIFDGVLVLAQSRDELWYYVASSTYRGWVSQADIALCNWEEFHQLTQPSDVLVCTSNTVFSQANPYDAAVSKQALEFAAYLPVRPDDSTGSGAVDHLGNQTRVGHFLVHLPVRNEAGWLDVRPAFVSNRAGVHLGFLPYTRASVVSSAFSLLTERYGWGDSFGNHDCSSLVMDAYRTVGLQLPRDADQQEDVLPNRVLFPEGATYDERDALLRTLNPGDPLYMSGHTMLYLGYSDGHHYVIHDFAGYSYQTEEGELKTVPVNEVMVSTLDILTSNGKTYLEALTCGASLFALTEGHELSVF